MQSTDNETKTNFGIAFSILLASLDGLFQVSISHDKKLSQNRPSDVMEKQRLRGNQRVWIVRSLLHLRLPFFDRLPAADV